MARTRAWTRRSTLTGMPKAAVGLHRDESVQGGPEGPDGVDGVVTVEAVAGHHRRYHPGPVGDRLVVGVAGAGARSAIW